MIGLTACVLGLAAATAPQNPPIFSVNREVKPPRVSADRDAVTAFGALTELGTAMGWTLLPQPDRIRNDLELVSLDLSFEDQDPRMIAQLLAAAGGVEVTFDDRSEVHSILHLIPLPDATSEPGQERLRNRAAQWYQRFMAGELDIDHAVLEEAMQVRMHLGHLMLKGGDFEGATRYFQEIYEQDRSHDYVPTALLRMAESFYELGDYEKAEHWCRELMRNHPSLPETAAATVLLGRTLLTQEKFDACRQTMGFSLLRLSDSPQIIDLCFLSKGLVLVTGPTGSGKSTTLAAMIDHINCNRTDHILTIEDPIEFVHPNKKCLINQREVGVHTDGFKVALRAALREDPDVVLVGELRDLETMAIAIETAETGHLVFGTLHTNTAASTVDRIIDQFPADRQAQIRAMLSESLKGVISQTLLKKKGGGRVAALEFLYVNTAVSNLIREGKTFQIPSIMQSNKAAGMKMLNVALVELVQAGQVEVKEALLKSVDRADLETQLSRAGVR